MVVYTWFLPFFYSLLLSVIFIPGYLISPTRWFTDWGQGQGQGLCWHFSESSVAPGRHLVVLDVGGLYAQVQHQEYSAKYTTAKLAKKCFCKFLKKWNLLVLALKCLQNVRHISKARNHYFSTKCTKLKLSSLK